MEAGTATATPSADTNPQALKKKEEVAPPSSKDDRKNELQQATEQANQAISGLGSDLKFSVDEDTGIDVVKFIDTETKEVIRQIPAQEMLVIAKRLDELRGLLIKDQA
ncbi:flagellar protein FlaG [Azospira sp. APE16]|uniref:flagellar protein FlaG n=1 Tax=Azospira sp. APE16 TaxID=3394231 RepID=UPI003A4E5B40